MRTVGPEFTLYPKQQSYYSAPGGASHDNLYPSDWDSTFEAVNRQETMEDEMLPHPPCGFKPCEHVKLRGDWMKPGRYETSHFHPSSGLVALQDYSMASLMEQSGLKPYLAGLHANPPGAELTHADKWQMSSAWERAKPRLKPDLDLLVFLAEIHELPKLAKSLLTKLTSLFGSGKAGKALKYVDGLRVLAQHEDVGKGGMLKVVADETMHLSSENLLEYNFALAPTVSELIGMLSAVFSWRTKLAHLIVGAEKNQKCHVSFDSSEELEPVLVSGASCTLCEDLWGGPCVYAEHRTADRYVNSDVPGSYYYDTCPRGVKTRVGLTVFYRYTLPAWVGDANTKINALAAALGINPGLGTIWELIPFSFVLDWIFPIGKILDRARLDAFPIKTEILDVCWTKKVTREVILHGRPFFCPRSASSVTFYQGTIETFSRIVGTDPFTWIPAFRWPTGMQLLLGGALTR
jgi:hypothetical protein